MKIKNRVIWRSIGLVLANTLQGWMGTLNFRGAYYDISSDPAMAEYNGPMIFLLWHEYIPSIVYLRSHSRSAILVSQHQDGELVSQMARYAGFELIRGSTSRGGAQAIRQLMDLPGGRNIAMTPDGPRGPRRQLAPGCIYLASRLQIPLVSLAVGYDKPWRYQRAWDKFAIPRPGSRARLIASPPLAIPPNLDRDEIEFHRRRVQNIMLWMTDEAERWAADNQPRVGSRILYRAPGYFDAEKTTRPIHPYSPNSVLPIVSPREMIQNISILTDTPQNLVSSEPAPLRISDDSRLAS